MNSATDADRLARYDHFVAGIRAEGKVKTATYQQLFANRMTLEGIERRLRDAGL